MWQERGVKGWGRDRQGVSMADKGSGRQGVGVEWRGKWSLVDKVNKRRGMWQEIRVKARGEAAKGEPGRQGEQETMNVAGNRSEK